MVNLLPSLREYVVPLTIVQSVIWWPAIQACNFELKLIIIHLVQNNQFTGLDNEGPNAHISNFLEVCDTLKYNGVSETMRLHLFPFSLWDKTKAWLYSQTPDSITSWNELVSK